MISSSKQRIVWGLAAIAVIPLVSLIWVVDTYTAKKKAAVFAVHIDEYRDANEVLNRNRPERLLVMLGDSRIKQWRSASGTDGLAIVNRGIAGETTPQILARFEYDAIALFPSAIVLQGGINDLVAAALLPDESRSIIEAAKRNIRMMVNRARDKLVPIVLMTVVQPAKPPAIRRIVWSDNIRSYVEELNTFIRLIGNEPGVAVLDANDVLGANGEYLSLHYSIDTLHWSSAAYGELDIHLRVSLRQLNVIQ